MFKLITRQKGESYAINLEIFCVVKFCVKNVLVVS